MELSSEKLVLKELSGSPVDNVNEVLVNGTENGEQPL
jgi:hypothetical protein